MVNKKLILLLICIQLLSLYSCQTETCKGVIFKEGVSYKNSQLYSGTCITHHINGEVKSSLTFDLLEC